MKRLLCTTLGVAMMLVMAAPSFAFVCYPNPTCPDTMTIYGLRTVLNTVATCAPTTPNTTGSPGDTVLGVGGIVIGFDTIPTGFDIYVEMTGGGPTGANAGIDVFTHGTNLKTPYGLALGDSIVVEYARVANFNGDVEVESPNNNFSSPNIILRKVNSGNTQPGFVHGNSTDWKELLTNTFFAPYAGSLMTLDGPVRVARNYLTGGLSTRSMLVVRDAAPSDSVFIDFGKLSDQVPAAVGIYYTSISGIGNAAARGWRIMPRDEFDVVDQQPPGVVDGYAIADNQYRIVFDRSVTPASATNTGTDHYSLASFGTVTAATMDGTKAVILTVTGTGLSHGQSETVTVNMITGTTNGLTMSTPVPVTFLFGVLSCGEMSAPNPDSLAATPCRDVSRYLGSPIGSGVTGQFSNGPFGPRSTVTGIVAGIYGNLYYMEDANPDNNRGITVFAPPTALTLGHRYILAGNDEEFYSENEFAGIAYVSDQGAATLPSPVSLQVATAALDLCDNNAHVLNGSGDPVKDGRDYLSDLVKLENVKVVQRFPTLPTNGFHVAGPSFTYTDTIFCENQNTVLGTNSSSNPNYPAVGTLVDVIGCMHYTTGTGSPSFRVCPRSPADITYNKNPSSVGGSPSALSFAVYPNPARTAQIAFTLPKEGNVQLGVYDLVGRRVALLASGRMPAGTYQKIWHGVDDNGNRLRSGMYFYRLRAGDQVLNARAILLDN